MSIKAIPMHKRLAMGDRVDKYATGGMVTPRTVVAIPRVALPMPLRRGPLNPVTLAKRDNGVPGMKKGGKVKKK